MAKSGDELEHPVTGERIVWRQSLGTRTASGSRSTCSPSPGGHPAAAHVHPNQEERFGVLAGTITLRVDGEEIDARVRRVGRGAGQDGPHTWWNDSHEDAHVLVQVSPALRTEMFFETFFGLAKDGKTNSKGLPNLAEHGRDPAGVPATRFGWLAHQPSSRPRCSDLSRSWGDASVIAAGTRSTRLSRWRDPQHPGKRESSTSEDLPPASMRCHAAVCAVMPMCGRVIPEE